MLATSGVPRRDTCRARGAGGGRGPARRTRGRPRPRQPMSTATMSRRTTSSSSRRDRHRAETAVGDGPASPNSGAAGVLADVVEAEAEARDLGVGADHVVAADRQTEIRTARGMSRFGCAVSSARFADGLEAGEQQHAVQDSEEDAVEALRRRARVERRRDVVACADLDDHVDEEDQDHRDRDQRQHQLGPGRERHTEEQHRPSAPAGPGPSRVRGGTSGRTRRSACRGESRRS